jgi:hypothetical protein
MPIPVEHISPVIKMSKFAWFPGRLDPTSFAIGTRSTLAIVWLIKVEMTCRKDEHSDIRLHESYGNRQLTRTTGDRTRTTVYKERPLTRCRISSSNTSSRPLDVTPLPNAIPPIAKNTIVHANCSKSS